MLFVAIMARPMLMTVDVSNYWKSIIMVQQFVRVEETIAKNIT